MTDTSMEVPVTWEKNFVAQKHNVVGLKRLTDSGCNRQWILWLLWYDCNPEHWKITRGSHRDNRRNIARFKKGLRALSPELITQIEQCLQFFRCGEPTLQQIPNSLVEFRRWFDLNCALNKSKRLNFHAKLSALMLHCRIHVQQGKRVRYGWMNDLADLVNGAFDTFMWSKARPQVTADSIRRFQERERIYARRAMQHFSSKKS